MWDSNREGFEAFHAMFYPRAVAVVGASTHRGKVGNFVLRSALASHVEKIYPVHAGGAREILGVKAYPSIGDIPDDHVDLFLFAIPHEHILSSFEAAVVKGCRGAVIYTAGFREAGQEGLEKQRRLRSMADEAGVKIIGPNTMGFYRVDSAMNATFMPVLSDFFQEKGRITVVSQSGGVAGFAAIRFVEDRVPMGTLVCLGNRANVEFADMLDFCAHDKETSVVALFIEGLDDVRRFYESAARCAAQKPVVVLGAGYSAAGQKVARSHTGSMARSEAIYDGVFRQAGLIQVRTVEELVDTAKILDISPRPQGNRVGVITHTAGPAVLASDVLSHKGLVLAELSKKTQKALVARKVLAPFTPPENPVDLTTFGYLDRRLYGDVLELLGEDPGVDAVLAICISALGDPYVAPFPMEAFGRKARQIGKPAVFVWGAPSCASEEFLAWKKAGVAAYATAERAAAALANLWAASRRGREVQKAVKEKPLPESLHRFVQDLRSLGPRLCGETETKELLQRAGLPTARTVVAATEEEAVRAAESMGYPVVLKIVSPDIVHKSDVGGVQLGLNDEDGLRRAFRAMMEQVRRAVPEARILGTAVQPMVPEGLEVIVGGFRDPQAGPVVMFGLGGIWVEAFNDVVFRLAPVSVDEARRMIEEIRGKKVLEGLRGRPSANKEALAHLIVTIGQLMDQLPIQEIDGNPVMVHGNTYTIVDARMSVF
ncbi:acetate--CoA ligase family protein [Desulfosoma caldarium]|uniref:Acetyltransferase n=1 Tax=Desulfosoma caldarium TaxID=610254 RepID=A0A3N1UEA9_9BACT|nr:acetate--CoA ligase family protein [Desulfosoma caldarium]ROQ89574.1 acetyltransferase [Desulfosoma caldarium]